MAVPKEEPRFDTLRDSPETSPYLPLLLFWKARLHNGDRRGRHDARSDS
ncbi:hypothetical protein [Streptomyces sp. NPDC050388]